MSNFERFSAIDLNLLPPLQVVEELDFEAVLAEMKSDLQSRFSGFSALVESDPAMKILEVAAYREILIRNRVNQSARSVFLGTATGADLENLAAFYLVSRLEGESDDALRARIITALETFSTAGPEGAYLFHTLKVEGVADAQIHSPEPGKVDVWIRGEITEENPTGLPAGVTMNAVASMLNDDEIRPLTDLVEVKSANPSSTTLSIDIALKNNAPRDVVQAKVEKSLGNWKSRAQKIGSGATLYSLYAALDIEGIDNVTVNLPTADIYAEPGEFILFEPEIINLS